MQVGETLVHTVEKCEKKMNKLEIAWLLTLLLAGPVLLNPRKIVLREQKDDGRQCLNPPESSGATDVKGRSILEVSECLSLNYE